MASSLVHSTTQSLLLRQWVDPDVWVDASTDWGIGVVIGSQWMAWKLVHGWKSEGRDIGWGESIALKLAILLLVDHGFKDCLIAIWGDNTGITRKVTKYSPQ